MNVGRAVALAGLIIFLYGYGSGAYIAFTEDDLYGWLYLIFPPYAAYYFVSRWDEMSSRLVMLIVGLAMLAGGGRLLETARALPTRATKEAIAAPPELMLPFRSTRGSAGARRAGTSAGRSGRRRRCGSRCRGYGRASRTRSGMRPAAP